MKKIFRTIAIMMLCGALAIPMADARGRNSNGGGNNGHSQTARPSSQRPGNNSNHNGNHKPDNNFRPNNGGNIGSHRPDYRPANPPKPNHGHGPVRPNLPPHHGWYRPTPPRGWQAPRHWRPFNSILGISLGTALNISINALINSGYNVSRYGNDAVYVTNVPMLNMTWPDAALFYNAVGGLCGSRFIYSTPFYDMTRYNSTYSILMNQYGAPMSVQTTSGGVEATWWGTGNQFIRLAFGPQYISNGDMRYFTTLSFGN